MNIHTGHTGCNGYDGNLESTTAAQVFGALSQETRLAVLRLLVAAGPNGLPAGEVANRLGLPHSTTSFHLSALERAGLTQSTRQSRQIIHAARVAALRELVVFLTETCCSGRPELCGDIARLLPDIPEESSAMIPAFNVLFLCTRNSARSIMAEAILTEVGGARFRAYSARADPAPQRLDGIVETLRRLGHAVSGLHSKSWDRFTKPDAPRMDFIIALCDVLEGQGCPDLGNTAVTGTWPLPDPNKFSGNEAERGLLLNELYASLKRRIDIFTCLPFGSLDRIALKARLDELGGGSMEASIEAALPDWSLAPVVRALQALRGMALIAAATLAAELDDITRFDNPRQLMAYLGLVPSEHSSGSTRRQGAITKAGNGAARRMLIEAAWTYRFLARISRELLLRQEGLAKPIRDTAWKAQEWLCRRYRKLARAGKPANVVTAAIARELAGFVWAIARQAQPSAA
jgi:ArsR family transcriptional regulator, arsenate/arsenite/antimonite-responsive transcriptional repressor / arsenate reductase (thioredoxin)